MKTEKYPEKSWIDPRIHILESKVHGKGLFAQQSIAEGETVEIFGGTLFTQKEIDEGKHRPLTAIKVDDDAYLALPKGTTEVTIDEYTNHSCDPTCWLTDEVTLVARRDIYPGEEITMDYGTWDDEPGYIWFENCSCGSTLCRHKVTGDDWKLKNLQKRYEGHFSPFIQRKIQSETRLLYGI